MKNYIFAPSPLLLACWLVVGNAHAQTIRFSGDTFPTGEFGGREEFSSLMTVGDLDVGSLDITSGAVFNQTRRTLVGSEAGSTGNVNITQGGEWHVREISLGYKGAANVVINTGGKLISDRAYLGQVAGAHANVTVDGHGSSWIIPSKYDLWIGNDAGSASLRILNGGTVHTTSDIITSFRNASSSSIEIDGENSNLRADEFCYLGASAPTSVKITNGGLLSCGRTTYLAWGDVSLSGAGSKWTTRTDLDVGLSRGTHGTLSIGNGSAVEIAGNLRLAADSTGYNGGGTLNILGSNEPGILRAQNVVFGNSRLNTINFKHTNTSGSYRFAPSISTIAESSGTINILGSGTTVFSGNNTFFGHTNIQEGLLRAGSATALSSRATYSISRSGTLDMNGFSLTAPYLNNAGTLIIGSGNTTTVVGANHQYKGYGGTIHMNAALGGNTSATQKLVVSGNTSGTTTLHIRNLGGTGAQTTGNGILVVQVGLESNGQFTLPAPGYIQAGAYRYTLHKVGRNWYLQSAPANAKAAAADDSAACVADPLAQGCALAPGQGAVAKALPAALKAGTANAAAAEAEAAAPTADASAQLEAALGADDLKDDGAVGFTGAVPVPGLGMVGMVSLSSLIGVAGLRRGRKAV